MYKLLLTSLIFHFVIDNTSTLNIDTTNPIIISDLFDGTDSFFGMSVNLLEMDELSNSPESSAWVIIGSPKANSTHQNHNGIFEPGVVWRCSLGRNPKDFCEVLVMDRTGNKHFREADGFGDVLDRKDGGWLGGAMISSSGANSRFVTCANRWQNQWLAEQTNYTQHYMMNGICYWRPTKHLTAERIVPDVPSNYRILPLRNKDNQALKTEFVWAFGQSGFSAHITGDNQMIIGAPGMNAWKGGVIHISDSKARVPLKRNGQPDEYGGKFENILVSKSDMNEQLKLNDSYLGYAVTSGQFIRSPAEQSNSKTQFAAGAPRGSNLLGKVVIFTFPTRGSKLNILLEINGTKIGTYFGSVICSVDVNNDGFDDLLIGAPLFSTNLSPKLAAFKAEPGPQFSAALIKPDNSGDEGRVFVYLSTGIDMKKSVELNGASFAGSRFGTAISTIGDINKDGYNDIAIGAPYERDGTGAVYIYFGSIYGTVRTYSQVILARNLHSSLEGFGHSLSFGADIDQNGYNDLAVGSFASSQTVILRTKPIVNIIGSIRSNMQKLPLNSTGFRFEACVNYTGKHAPIYLDISMQLTMDVDSKPPRVHIRKTETNGMVTKTHIFKNVALGQLSCEPMTAVVLNPLAVSGNPITTKTEVSLMVEKTGVNPTFYELTLGANGFPKVTAVGPKFDSFCTDCPVQDTESTGKANYFSLPLELPCGSDNKCVADLRLKGSFLDINPGKGFVIGSKTSLSLEIVIENFGEAALSPTIKVSWPKINLLKIPANCEPDSAGDYSELSYLCRFGEILFSDTNAKIVLEFDTREQYVNENEKKFEVTVIARTISEMTITPVLNIEIPFVFEGDIFMTAKETTLHLSTETVNEYQFFTHSFEVGLDGISSVDLVSLHFAVPVKLSGQENQPIVEITNLRAFLDGEVLQCLRSEVNDPRNFRLDTSNDSEIIEIINPSNLLEPVKSQNLEIEDLNEVISQNPKIVKQTETPKKLTEKGILRLDCLSPHVKCDEFTCKLNKFKPSNHANIDFSLKIRTEEIQNLMKEQKAEAFHIHSTGKATISVYSNYEPPIGHKLDETDAVTKIELDSADVPKWVYMASFSGGFIILGSLIFCFYACGCFERKKKPEENEAVQDPKSKPLQSQTIPEEDESEVGNFSREEITSLKDRQSHY